MLHKYVETKKERLHKKSKRQALSTPQMQRQIIVQNPSNGGKSTPLYPKALQSRISKNLQVYDLSLFPPYKLSTLLQSMEPWQNATEDLTTEEWLKRDRNRDHYFRCKHCKKLWHQEQCILNEVDGYQCPDGCIESFEQPPYQSPLNG